ncbi:hypothetical protein ACK3TF_005544 [Chlorella vulgaris]
MHKLKPAAVAPPTHFFSHLHSLPALTCKPVGGLETGGDSHWCRRLAQLSQPPSLSLTSKKRFLARAGKKPATAPNRWRNHHGRLACVTNRPHLAGLWGVCLGVGEGCRLDAYERKRPGSAPVCV